MKEIHIVLDNSNVGNNSICVNFTDTENAIKNNQDIIYTTQTHFLSFRYLPVKLFVHYKNELHEIKIGNTEGTDKEIRECHNIEKMLLTGVFDWF